MATEASYYVNKNTDDDGAMRFTATDVSGFRNQRIESISAVSRPADQRLERLADTTRR